MNRTVYQPNPGCSCKSGMMPVQKIPCHQPGGTVHAGAAPVCSAQPRGTAVHGGAAVTHDGVLAMAYVHVQSLGALYDPCAALIAGTLFPDLDKPFCGETVSASAYPNPPARTCDCALPQRRDGSMGCGGKGGVGHD